MRRSCRRKAGEVMRVQDGTFDEVMKMLPIRDVVMVLKWGAVITLAVMVALVLIYVIIEGTRRFVRHRKVCK